MALHDAPRLYTLEVFIVEGPMTEDFLDENPVISRSIQIRGDQTLGQLHDAVFAAFDREDAHLYEFQIGGAGPMDPEARRYTHPMAVADPFAEGARAGDAERTTLESLGLETDEAFSYWFAPPRGRFPKVTGRVGASPPQYVDWDELEG
jgi:hypothetical protein